MSFCQARERLILAGAVLTAAALVAGCGNNYRPTITPVNSTGPASTINTLVSVVSAPSRTVPGIVTILDYAGDSVMDYQPIGIGPTAYTVDTDSTYGYTINSDHTLSEFQITSTLQKNQILVSTLPSTAQPLNLFSPSAGLWVPDLSDNTVDIFTGGPETYLSSVPVAPTPVMVIGPTSAGLRFFSISQGFAAPTGVECNAAPASVAVNGEADGIEPSSYTISSHIPLGKCPVFAVESSDGRRLFVMNRGSDTITVINAQNDTLNSCVCPPTGCLNYSNQAYYCHPTLPLSTTAAGILNAGNPAGYPPIPINGTAGMTAVAGPVYAEYNGLLDLLVVSNYDGSTISVIDVSLDEYGNDSPTFGTTYTIPVDKNPASVTVLADGSRAYTANQSDQTVSIVNLSSHTVEGTLTVTGHPRTVASVQNSTQGKVYVASPDSPYLTIIRTDQDIVEATQQVQGNIVDVRVSAQTGSGGNSNGNTRIPGYGQPCNLPGAGPVVSITACQALP